MSSFLEIHRDFLDKIVQGNAAGVLDEKENGYIMDPLI